MTLTLGVVFPEAQKARFLAIWLYRFHRARYISFRYHVSLDYRDAYPDDLAKVRTVTDTLTGTTTTTHLSWKECADAQEQGLREP
jgi:hypothetical protein